MYNIKEFITTCESLMIGEDDVAMEGVADLVVTIGLIAIGLGIRNYKDHKRDKENKTKRNKYEKQREEKLDEKRQTQDELKVQFRQVHEDIKKIVMALKRDKDLSLKISDKLKTSELTENYSKMELKYVLISDIFEQGDDDLIVEVIDADQMVRVELSFILWDIVKVLEVKYQKLSFGTGDGDEGCIYVGGYLKNN